MTGSMTALRMLLSASPKERAELAKAIRISAQKSRSIQAETLEGFGITGELAESLTDSPRLGYEVFLKAAIMAEDAAQQVEPQLLFNLLTMADIGTLGHIVTVMDFDSFTSEVVLSFMKD